MGINLRQALERELKHIIDRYGYSLEKAFLFWFATEIIEIDESASIEAISIEGANDKGIDFFFKDDEEGRVLIAQGKYSRTLSYPAKESDVAKLESSLNWLANPESLEREGKPELAQATRDYLEARKDGYGVELMYVYAGKKSVNVDKKIAVYNQNEENIVQRRTFRHYHIDLLKDLWEEIQGGRRRIENASIKIYGNCFETKGKFGDALVATVPCSEIIQLYRLHGDRLFDRNVRLFLGARKGSVNAGIAATIKDPRDRANFWAYNNGITIICDRFKAENEAITLTNFSIVNGCQTTVSLAENDGDAPELLVLVRLIAASAEIANDIIRYTNSQNPIRTWDIASQEKTQRRLKSEFERLKKPYIYLTRRGDKPSGTLNKYREGKRLRQIRIDTVGQLMAAFRKMPVLAYKDKAFVFSKHHDEVFPPDIRVQEVLFCWLCGERCREVVLKKMKETEENTRILKKGGTLFTLAVMAEALKERNGATYLSNMAEEQITSARGRERLLKYANYSALIYLSAVKDEVQIQGGELTTLIRQKEFFEKVLKRSMDTYQRDSLNKDWLKGALPKLT